MQLSPEQFHTLFDRAAQPVLLVQDGVITQCSSRAEGLIAPGSPIRELLPPDAVLMEIKIPGAAPLWLSRLLTDAGAFPGAFSKYGTFYETHILNQTFHAKEAACCA